MPRTNEQTKVTTQGIKSISATHDMLQPTH